MDDKLVAEGFIMTMQITNEVTIDCLNEILRQQRERKLDTLPDPRLIEIAIDRFKSEQALMKEDGERIVQNILDGKSKDPKS